MRYLAFALLLAVAAACKGGDPTTPASFESIRPLVTYPTPHFEVWWGGRLGDEAFVREFKTAYEKNSNSSLTPLEIMRVETRILPRFKRLAWEAYLLNPTTTSITKFIEKRTTGRGKEMMEMLK